MDMMSLIKKKETLSIRRHTVLYVLIGLLVSGASCQAADTPEEEVSSLRLKLNLLMNRYGLLCNQFSNLATNCSAPVINCTECPDGWLRVGDQCFLLSTDRDDYFKSANKCTEIGGHLAILTTKEQHEAMEQEGKRIGGIYIYYWIGLSDIENEGDWKWVDNSKLKTPFWDVLNSEPGNTLSGGLEGEDCAVVNSNTQTWSDVPCSFTYPRICQMDALPLQ
ncbi:perlucin-like protein [Anoplopoma fimbria]|uniref:perlucin-like protein n=1 Tax=Anoplopoma fimbria TaxID=229290 RepID=UPI0023EABD7C|nr:perlucin-like protein [Anoplopoma fimbria]